MLPRVLLALAVLALAPLALPASHAAADCPAAHQGLGEVYGEASGGLFILGAWTEACPEDGDCADAAAGSVHGLEGFPVGPLHVTELFDTAFGCIVECAFPAYGILYRGPGGFVTPGVNAWGERIVTFSCPGGFEGEMRANAF